MAFDPHTLLNLGDLPVALVGALFSFGKKKPDPADPRQIEAVDRCVTEFLENRQVGKFMVFTTLHDGRPIVHIQAEAHKNLRFSNLIEIRIRQYVEEKTGLEIGPIYWRFQMESAEEPAVEQSSYEDYSAPPQTSTPPARPSPDTSHPEPVSSLRSEPDAEESHDYDIHRLAREGIDVQEISASELEALIGNQPFPKKDSE